MSFVRVVSVTFLFSVGFVSSSKCSEKISPKKIELSEVNFSKFYNRKFPNFKNIGLDDLSTMKVAVDQEPKKAFKSLKDKKNQTLFHLFLFHANSFDNFKVFCTCVETESLLNHLTKKTLLNFLKKINENTRKDYVKFLIEKELLSCEEAVKHNFISDEKEERAFPKGWQ